MKISMPLEGIRILDMTTGQHGPVATQMLADMGADVIKVEGPANMDGGRGMVAIAGSEVPRNSYFENNNRNKRAITVDLKKEKGREIIYRLVEKSDVFVTNYREAAVKELGMDCAALTGLNARLIYAIGHGFGRYGPDSEKPALDFAAQARGGIWSISGEPGEPPARIGAGMADQVGAGILAYGIMLALFARERTGEGQEVNTSLLGSQAWLGSVVLQHYLFSGEAVPSVSRVSRKEIKNPLWSVYECQDGKWVCLAMLGSDPYWSDFCWVMGIEHLEKDPRFENQLTRMENATELITILDGRFASKVREDWIQRFNERELIWAPVNDYADLSADPQMRANDYIVDFEHPTHGPVKMVGIPVKLSKMPGQIRRPAPEPGQHTEEILIEIGDYSWEDIARLRDEEII